MKNVKKKRCPKCQIRKAEYSNELGVIECKECQLQGKKPKRTVEMTTDSIRESRREYKKDIIQPYRNGILSKEYLEEYGTAGVKATEQEIKNAEYTLKDTVNWWNREKSKGGRK